MSNPKETRFFNKSSGLEEYLTFFNHSENYKAIGEFTPQYLHKGPIVAERILETLGSIKILLILRNPVMRYISHYRWLIGRYDIIDKKESLLLDKATFDKANALNDRILKQGIYSENLKVFMDVFGRHQVHTMIYEDVFKHPAREVRKLYDFLGVDPNFETPVIGKQVRGGYVPRYRFLEQGKRHVYQFLKHRARGTIKYIRVLQPEYILKLINRKKSEQLRVEPEVITLLGEYYREEIEKMRHLLNLDLADWGS